MRSLKAECLDRMIFFGEPALRRAINEFLRHHHEERNHQGIGNRLIDPGGGGRPRRRPPPLPRAAWRDAPVLLPRRCIGSFVPSPPSPIQNSADNSRLRAALAAERRPRPPSARPGAAPTEPRKPRFQQQLGLVQILSPYGVVQADLAILVEEEAEER